MELSPEPSPDVPPAPAHMASVATPPPAAILTGPKRYRPAPAKTFQCRGFGECRMVFSRSEHLARHIRKHTGERPFSCHCSKQFSRLDNLRQHAQTVHADKQEQNERMMRDLTSLHATMAAASKGTPRGPRRPGPATAAAPGHQVGEITKTEDLVLSLRPGTSTGYEGDLWHPADAHRPGNHSFRDPSQSFLESHSFRAFGGYDARPGSAATSRPPTASGPPPASSTDTPSPGQGRTLPPLAAVVSASLAPSPPQHHQQPPQLNVLSFPSFRHRPSTATRPGTAPAFFSKSSYGPGLAARPELLSGFGRPAPPSSFDAMGLGPDAEQGQHDSPFYFNAPSLPDTQPPVPSNPRKRGFAGPDGPYDDAPPASSASAPPREPPTSSHGFNEYGSDSRPQSRRLSVMELCNDTDAHPPSSAHGPTPGSAAFLLSSANALAAHPTFGGPAPATSHTNYGASQSGNGGGAYGGFGRAGDRQCSGSGPGSPESRPTTSSGLVSSTSSLHIFDRGSPISASPPILSRIKGIPAAAAAANGGGGAGGARWDGEEEFGAGGFGRGGGVSPSSAVSGAVPGAAGAGALSGATAAAESLRRLSSGSATATTVLSPPPYVGRSRSGSGVGGAGEQPQQQQQHAYSYFSRTQSAPSAHAGGGAVVFPATAAARDAGEDAGSPGSFGSDDGGDGGDDGASSASSASSAYGSRAVAAAAAASRAGAAGSAPASAATTPTLSSPLVPTAPSASASAYSTSGSLSPSASPAAATASPTTGAAAFAASAFAVVGQSVFGDAVGAAAVSRRDGYDGGGGASATTATTPAAAAATSSAASSAASSPSPSPSTTGTAAAVPGPGERGESQREQQYEQWEREREWAHREREREWAQHHHHHNPAQFQLQYQQQQQWGRDEHQLPRQQQHHQHHQHHHQQQHQQQRPRQQRQRQRGQRRGSPGGAGGGSAVGSAAEQVRGFSPHSPHVVGMSV